MARGARGISLRARLTMFMAALLLVACSALTLTLVYSADKIYQPISAMPTPVGSGTVGAPSPASDTQKGDLDKDFRTASLVTIVVVFVVGVGATYMIAGKALRPIRKLSRTIEEMDEDSLFTPLPETGSTDEVGVLSTSFNHLVGRLDKAFVAQKNFAANAAHELKTPLAAIISRVEVSLLDGEPSVEECEDALVDVLHNAERMSGLVNELLELYSSANSLPLTVFDARAMFSDLIEEALRDNPKNVVVVNRVGELHLAGDRDLLYRAFFNIVQNAIKYNRENGTVIVSSVGDRDGVLISIADTGIGIPHDQIDRIFEPFYRVDQSRARLLGGNGLGLALAKMVVEKHGGHITVDSVEGSSTTVTIVLP